MKTKSVVVNTIGEAFGVTNHHNVRVAVRKQDTRRGSYEASVTLFTKGYSYRVDRKVLERGLTLDQAKERLQGYADKVKSEGRGEVAFQVLYEVEETVTQPVVQTEVEAVVETAVEEMATA